MEYIEGCSLAALLRKTPSERSPRLLVPIVLDMLAGLDAAHSLVDDDDQPLHLVHRDVSPQNVLVGIDGTARITDFGIARADSRITTTRPGQVKGKLAFMAPEQIRSQDVDRRADIFSAGAMLWPLLTGRRLFVGDSDAATLNNIIHGQDPAAEHDRLETAPGIRRGVSARPRARPRQAVRHRAGDGRGAAGGRRRGRRARFAARRRRVGGARVPRGARRASSGDPGGRDRDGRGLGCARPRAA